MSWSKDDWVAVGYEGEWYPGVVNEVDNLITVKSMSFPSFGKNCLNGQHAMMYFNMNQMIYYAKLHLQNL